jgi:hypothetical protein
MNSNNIKNIMFGVRFRRNFAVRDIIGQMTENLIRPIDSPLGKTLDYFTQTSNELVLSNKENPENFLRLNTDDLIFSLPVKSGQFEECFKQIKQIFTYSTDLLFDNYNIRNVQRIGIVFDHLKEGDDDIATSTVKLLTNNEFNDVNTFDFSFSKKMPMTGGSLRKGVDDYINLIFLFKKNNSQSMQLSLDYQRFYIPEHQEIGIEEKNSFLSVFDSARSYLDERYYKIIVNHEEKTPIPKGESTKETVRSKKSYR